jgi:hypothetical protein
MAVRGLTGAPIGAVTISAPTVRFSRGKVAELLPALTETVEAIRSDIISLAAPSRAGGTPGPAGPVADKARSLAFPH